MKKLAVKGNGYLGSPSMQPSSANQELVPAPPANWTYGYKLKKFSFNNEQNCTVRINGAVTIFLKAGQGFEVSHDDFPITSFKIVEANVTFNWIGSY